MPTITWLRCWLPVLALLALGCSKGPKPLVPVTGKVTYHGHPVPGGTIVFTPDAKRGERGPIAAGEIAQDGTYVLRTGADHGVPAGAYRVTIVAVSATSPGLPGQPYRIPVSLVPEKYRDPELSQLTATVEPDRTNTRDFDLQ